MLPSPREDGDRGNNFTVSRSYNCSSKLTSQFKHRRRGNDAQARHFPKHRIKQNEPGNAAVLSEASSRHDGVEQKHEKQEMHNLDRNGNGEDNSAVPDSFQFNFDIGTDNHYDKSSKGFSFGFLMPEMSMDSSAPIPPTVEQHKSSKKSRKKKKKKKKKKNTNSNTKGSVKNDGYQNGPELALHLYDATDPDTREICDKVYKDSKDPTFAAQKSNAHAKGLSNGSPLALHDCVPVAPKLPAVQPKPASKKMAPKSGEKTTAFQFDSEVRHRGAMVNKQSMGLHRQNRRLQQQRGKLHTQEKNNPFTFGFSGILPS